METYHTHQNHKFAEAKQRVKKMKGFYIHATVFLAVNFIIILGNIYESSSNLGSLDTYATAFFWGIGLFAHAASVFGMPWLLGKDWEEKKIYQMMQK